MKAIQLKDHLYDNVYGYRGHEIWISTKPDELRKGEIRYFYYIDGNTVVKKKQLLAWYPSFKTMNEAVEHGQKRIENMNLESALVKKLS